MSDSIASLVYEKVAKDASLMVQPVVVADYNTGEILHVNQLAEQIFGYDPGELLGKPVEMLIPDDGTRERHQQHRLAPALARARVMGFGQAPLRGLRKDGTVFPAYIGLAEVHEVGRRIGVTFIIDMTGYAPESPAGLLCPAPAKEKGQP